MEINDYIRGWTVLWWPTWRTPRHEQLEELDVIFNLMHFTSHQTWWISPRIQLINCVQDQTWQVWLTWWSPCHNQIYELHPLGAGRNLRWPTSRVWHFLSQKARETFMTNLRIRGTFSCLCQQLRKGKELRRKSAHISKLWQLLWRQILTENSFG